MVASAKQPLSEFENTGERHIPVQAGEDMSLANVDHMIRYAFVAPFVKEKRVLDISCGTGYGTQFIALQGASDVIGVDVDEAAIQFASKFYNHPCVRYLQSDAHNVRQLEDAAFDVIVSFETIEHLPQPRQFLVELRRLLKPGGQIFLSCPNDYRVSPWISQFHLHKFRFLEFRDLFLSVFGEAVFLGQHLVVASCIFKPSASSAKVERFDTYQNGKHNFFNYQYLEHLSSIEQADGYLAILGVDESRLQSQMSLSQNAFQLMMRHLCNTVEVSAEREQLRQAIDQMQQELVRSQHETWVAQTRVKAMETSKFWQLRKAWFYFKKKLGLPTQE